MTRIWAKHEPYQDGHLGKVVAEMRCMNNLRAGEYSCTAGWPTIRVVKLSSGGQPGFADGYAALEGSHRLAAAHYLGLGVKLVEVEPDALSPIDWEAIAGSLPLYEWEPGTCLLLRLGNC